MVLRNSSDQVNSSGDFVATSPMVTAFCHFGPSDCFIKIPQIRKFYLLLESVAHLAQKYRMCWTWFSVDLCIWWSPDGDAKDCPLGIFGYGDVGPVACFASAGIR